MRTVVVAVLATLMLGVGAAPAATPKRANLGQIARTLVKSGAPGAIVYVRTPTGTRAGVAGYADRDAHVLMRAADRYRIASVTKAFTAVLALQLVAERRLDLRQTVQHYLPGELPATYPPVTVGQLGYALLLLQILEEGRDRHKPPRLATEASHQFDEPR